MSEISRIPISRCSTVSRLDRIRTLWRSMLPLGVSKRQRCVASSSAGHRAAPGPCPVWSVDEAPLLMSGKKVHDIGIKSEDETERGRISTRRNWNDLTPSIHGRLQYACLKICVRIILERLQTLCSYCFHLCFSLCEFHLKF